MANYIFEVETKHKCKIIYHTEQDNRKIEKGKTAMSKIAVYFPGIGYHCDKPLLYYSRKIACELGYEDYRNVNYTYKAENLRGNDEKMLEAYKALFSQAETALADIDWSACDDVLFVSKSIGTIIAASYAKKQELTDAKQVLYTPLAQTFSFAPVKAAAFIGTADPWSNTDDIIRLAEVNHIPLTVYEGCNHSLECGNSLKNIEILMDVMQKTRAFCSRE